MRAAVRVLALLAVIAAPACGGGDENSYDAAPAIDATAATGCRTLGAFTRAPAFATASGLPLHPQGIVADPFVVHDEHGYRLWFTSVDWTAGDTVFDATDRALGTAYIESADAITWDDSAVRPADPAHKVDLVLRPGDWDSEGVETVTVARSASDQLVLFHTGDRADGTNAIGRARSADGRGWTRDPAPVLVPEADWEQPVCLDPPACTTHLGGVLEPSVVIDASGVTHVWYAALGVRGADLTMQIGHAWSADGTTWQRAPEPVLTPGPPGAWDEILVSHTDVVHDPAGGYHLFYQGISRAQQDQCSAEGSCPFYTPGSIGHAFSLDGTTWTREPAPILEPVGDDAFFVGGPAAVIHDGTIDLFYFGIASRDDATSLRAHLARATAACGP